MSVRSMGRTDSSLSAVLWPTLRSEPPPVYVNISQIRTCLPSETDISKVVVEAINMFLDELVASFCRKLPALPTLRMMLYTVAEFFPTSSLQNTCMKRCLSVSNAYRNRNNTRSTDKLEWLLKCIWTSHISLNESEASDQQVSDTDGDQFLSLDDSFDVDYSRDKAPLTRKELVDLFRHWASRSSTSSLSSHLWAAAKYWVMPATADQKRYRDYADLLAILKVIVETVADHLAQKLGTHAQHHGLHWVSVKDFLDLLDEDSELENVFHSMSWRQEIHAVIYPSDPNLPNVKSYSSPPTLSNLSSKSNSHCGEIYPYSKGAYKDIPINQGASVSLPKLHQSLMPTRSHHQKLRTSSSATSLRKGKNSTELKGQLSLSPPTARRSRWNRNSSARSESPSTPPSMLPYETLPSLARFCGVLPNTEWQKSRAEVRLATVVANRSVRQPRSSSLPPSRGRKVPKLASSMPRIVVTEASSDS